MSYSLAIRRLNKAVTLQSPPRVNKRDEVKSVMACYPGWHRSPALVGHVAVFAVIKKNADLIIFMYIQRGVI